MPPPVPVALPTLPQRKNRDTNDNLEAFKAEIVERTHRGEKAGSIAADLVSRSVNTNESAVSYRRLRWVIRVRKPGVHTGPPASRSIWLPAGIVDEDYESRALDAVQCLGLDPTTADLTTSGRSGSYRPGGWLYPHRQGARSPSNLDVFKEIIERTRNGESCAEVADALMAKGVQTSYCAVNRRRLLWGLRKRTSRKNLKAPPLDVAGRDMRNKSPRYNKTHPERAAVMRRLELTRLTKEGLSAQEILDHFSARGVVWKRGVPSILNLQTRWGLISPQDNPRYVSSKTSQAMKAARKGPKAAFTEIAQDLGVENSVKWVGTKLKEPASKEARTKLAKEKAGSLAPPLKYTKDGKPGRLTGIVAWRSRVKKKQAKPKARHDRVT